MNGKGKLSVENGIKQMNFDNFKLVSGIEKKLLFLGKDSVKARGVRGGGDP